MKTKSTDERMSSNEAVSGSFTGLNPVCRLSESTRKLATRYLSGEFGLNMRDAQFSISS